MTKITKGTKVTTKVTTKVSDFNDLKKQCNDYIAESFSKTTEATAMLRASVILYTIKSCYNYSLKDIIADLPNLQNYGEKSQKNLMRFAKNIKKNKLYKSKLSLESITDWCLQADIRGYYDALINPNRKKASSTLANPAPANPAPANPAPANPAPAGKFENEKNDIELFIDSLSLSELKEAFTLIGARLNINIDCSKLAQIKKIAY